MKVFLWVLKESGAEGVPSFKQLRDVQTKLRETSGTPSELHKSAHGNLFYMNDIRKIVANVSCPSHSIWLGLLNASHSRITLTPSCDRISMPTLKSPTVLSRRSGMQRSGGRRWIYDS